MPQGEMTVDPDRARDGMRIMDEAFTNALNSMRGGTYTRDGAFALLNGAADSLVGYNRLERHYAASAVMREAANFPDERVPGAVEAYLAQRDAAFALFDSLVSKSRTETEKGE